MENITEITRQWKELSISDKNTFLIFLMKEYSFEGVVDPVYCNGCKMVGCFDNIKMKWHPCEFYNCEKCEHDYCEKCIPKDPETCIEEDICKNCEKK